jgi:hypothetical protein
MEKHELDIANIVLRETSESKRVEAGGHLRTMHNIDHHQVY